MKWQKGSNVKMINVNMKARLTSKTWWIGIISLVILLSQQCGFDLSQYIPKNYADIVNTIFTLLAGIGITVDTSSKGISDTTIAQTTVQAVNDSNETKEEVKTESTTTAVNNTVTDKSASSKIVVDNPDNTKSIGQEVNATSAVKPQ
ncbi:bacteriophage holin [Clostridium saccharobutylicum]|uniref:phage holin n=1 Tax=Clostridium saccharobutylicum TaxID=169679 RepID=UPI0009D6078E|nr:phage holin [Clostridium saccharobutylicum]OOM17232.1 bacteriophage holin [Clostridium saccharobutylicum]